MAQRVEVTVNLGAGAPIEVLRQVIDDLDTVCQFGGELQYLTAVAYAELAVLRRPGRWIPPRYLDDFFASAETIPSGAAVPLEWYGDPVPRVIVGSAVSRYLAENDPSRDTTTTVESIRFSNPLEIVLGVGLLTLAGLQVARDWRDRRRVNAAVAADIENTVAARREIRDELVRRFVEERVPLAPNHIDELLTLDVARAMQALGNAQPNLRELPAGDDQDASDTS